MDDLDNLWCAYLLLMGDRPDLAAQVHTRILELRLKELGRDLEMLYRRVAAQKEDEQCYVVRGLVTRVSERADSFLPGAPRPDVRPKPRGSGPT